MSHRQYLKKFDPLVQFPPAVYCPANGMLNPADPNFPTNLQSYPSSLNSACTIAGYEKTIPTYTPDAAIPATSTPLTDESVVLITSTQLGGKVDMYFNTSSGTYTAKIYGSGNTLLDTKTISSGSIFSYIFLTTMAGYAASDGTKYFKVIVTPTTAGQSITQVRINSATVVYPIIEVYMNTPNLTIMNFDSQKILKKVWCCANMNSLNCTASTYKVFQNTYQLTDLTLPTSMNAQTNIDYWFAYSGVPKVVLPASMTSLSSFQYSFGFSNTKEITLPNYVTTSTYIRFYYAFNDMKYLKTLTIPATWSPTYVDLNYAFYNSINFESITVPSSIILSTFVRSFTYCRNFKGDGTGTFTIYNRTNDTNPIQYIFQECLLLKKVEFKNTANSITSTSTILDSSGVEEFIYPTSMNGLTSFPSLANPALKKITLPLSMTGLTSCSLLANTCVNVEQISTCTAWPTIVLSFSMVATLPRLKRFEQPTLRTTQLNLSNSSGAPGLLEYCEVDWVNSTWTGTINLSYNNLSVTEINRIFTALPTVTGTKTINVIGNQGYATCTKSIATAKGWTVS